MKTYKEIVDSKIGRDAEKKGHPITEEIFNEILRLKDKRILKLSKYKDESMRAKVLKEYTRDICLLFGFDHSTAMLAYYACCSNGRSAPKRVQPVLFYASIIEIMC